MATIDQYLEEARSKLSRVSPEDLPEALDRGAILVDIRPEMERSVEGAMPGALVIERNVLLWRLSPSSDARSVEVQPGQQVIVFCNDGYASSLAAATLHEVGVESATDLIGGYREWKRRHRARE